LTIFHNYCRWRSTTNGVGSFHVGAAEPPDAYGSHDLPVNCNSIDGKTYRYVAQSPDESQMEIGTGALNSAGTILARISIVENSDGTTLPVNFLVNPIVDIFPTPQVLEQLPAFPSGTRITFQQTAAPTFWTKITSYNDYALRVVSGTAGSGGSYGFSSIFSYRTDDPTYISEAQMPSHMHYDQTVYNSGGAGNKGGWLNGNGGFLSDQAIGGYYTGGSSYHQHTYDMRVAYIDVIIASKD
jgi:hypothetical protein